VLQRSKRKSKNNGNCKSKDTADVDGIVSQVIAEKHGANLEHPALVVAPLMAPNISFRSS
jgi:hypothetical protein